MKVAMVKLASTNRKRTAQHGGTAGQMVPANHGHLDAETGGKRILIKKKTVVKALTSAAQTHP